MISSADEARETFASIPPGLNEEADVCESIGTPEIGTQANPILVSDDLAPLGSASNPINIDEDWRSDSNQLSSNENTVSLASQYWETVTGGRSTVLADHIGSSARTPSGSPVGEEPEGLHSFGQLSADQVQSDNRAPKLAKITTFQEAMGRAGCKAVGDGEDTSGQADEQRTEKCNVSPTEGIEGYGMLEAPSMTGAASTPETTDETDSSARNDFSCGSDYVASKKREASTLRRSDRLAKRDRT